MSQYKLNTKQKKEFIKQCQGRLITMNKWINDDPNYIEVIIVSGTYREDYFIGITFWFDRNIGAMHCVKNEYRNYFNGFNEVKHNPNGTSEYGWIFHPREEEILKEYPEIQKCITDQKIDNQLSELLKENENG
jgi:hypothetical protein